MVKLLWCLKEIICLSTIESHAFRSEPVDNVPFTVSIERGGDSCANAWGQRVFCDGWKKEKEGGFWLVDGVEVWGSVLSTVVIVSPCTCPSSLRDSHLCITASPTVFVMALTLVSWLWDKKTWLGIHACKHQQIIQTWCLLLFSGWGLESLTAPSLFTIRLFSRVLSHMNTLCKWPNHWESTMAQWKKSLRRHSVSNEPPHGTSSFHFSNHEPVWIYVSSMYTTPRMWFMVLFNVWDELLLRGTDTWQHSFLQRGCGMFSLKLRPILFYGKSWKCLFF